MNSIIDGVAIKLKTGFGVNIEEATSLQMYKAVSMLVRDEIMEKWADDNLKTEKRKKKVVFYLSLEFLMGKFLGANLLAIGKYDQYRDALKQIGVDIERLEAVEQDSGLGNGGLGRLAACYLDSLSALSLPAIGCGIRYDYGLFRQKIVDGVQVEMPDNWLENGCSWEVMRSEEQYDILFGGKVNEFFDDFGNMRHKLDDCTRVLAVPYDIPICGGKGGVVNTLRIWSARSPVYFDMSYFGKGDYIRAGQERELAETISRVLYPNDSHNAGKSLRLRQQYFFTSATLQYMLSRHKKMGLAIKDLPEYAAVQINDTHPAIAIAELMRLLVDCECLPWDEAWNICVRVFSYTNHTIMREALECWPVYLMQNLLPRIYMIIKEIDRRFRLRAGEVYPFDGEKVNAMAPIAYDQINMANLCLATCKKVNGVSALHTEILRNGLFSDFQPLNKEQLINITNGVTPRRWLFQANPGLTSLVTKTLGTDKWMKDLLLLGELEKHINSELCAQFMAVKRENKLKLAEYIKNNNGIEVNPDSIFDIQVKRLHEYKRQLLNALHILYLYFDIVENKNYDRVPITFIFGAKASPGYERAKQIIQLINAIAGLVNNDERVRGLIKVVFMENYGVTLAQMLMPAADISEQISLAGKEASGTGNMKFMMNGAITIGTLDGANVEMHDILGDDNIYIFGLRANEAENALKYSQTSPRDIYSRNALLRRAIDAIGDGMLGSAVASIKSYLIDGDCADPYLCLLDFADYAEKHRTLEELYRSANEWAKKAIINTARSYYFSSDRSIREYNEKIWKLS